MLGGLVRTPSSPDRGSRSAEVVTWLDWMCASDLTDRADSKTLRLMHKTSSNLAWAVTGFVALGAGFALAGCKQEVAPEPSPTEQQTRANQAKKGATEQANAAARAKAVQPEEAKRAKPEADRNAAAKPAANVAAAPGDPHGGNFTLADATQGLPAKGKLVADIETDEGTLSCELFEDKAPITVANFVGLARGERAWKDNGKWVKKPLYDGTVFHRVVKGFMIQGGDPNGNGSGGPGYEIPDEIWEGATHDKRGQLCMANRGPNTNGSQFFIMDGSAPHLDGGYTIFGLCSPESVIEKLASTPVQGQRAITPPKIKSVKVTRKP